LITRSYVGGGVDAADGDGGIERPTTARRIPREDTPTMLTPLAARYQGREQRSRAERLSKPFSRLAVR
jgi:hypothetical protein